MQCFANVAVCCSVLQCVAACCSVLQRAVLCCSVCIVLQCLQCVAVYRSVLHCCIVLQCLQCVAVFAECCSVLQRAALCCSVLQCVTMKSIYSQQNEREMVAVMGSGGGGKVGERKSD